MLQSRTITFPVTGGISLWACDPLWYHGVSEVGIHTRNEKLMADGLWCSMTCSLCSDCS